MPYIVPDLSAFERKVRSQLGEDGIIEKISECLGINTGTFFEFGIGPAWNHPIEDGLEGNFVHLREQGWKGIFLDGAQYPPKYDVRQEFITPLNINTIYRKYGLPDDLDFMSIDVDGQELWIWLSLQARPKVVILEYNGGIGADPSISIQFDVTHRWDGTVYHGASLRALDKVAKDKGYTLVWSNGVNAVFIRDDRVSNKSDFAFERLFVPFTPHAPDPKNRPWVTI